MQINTALYTTAATQVNKGGNNLPPTNTDKA
jgi:hypothetical protein